MSNKFIPGDQWLDVDFQHDNTDKKVFKNANNMEYIKESNDETIKAVDELETKVDSIVIPDVSGFETKTAHTNDINAVTAKIPDVSSFETKTAHNADIATLETKTAHNADIATLNDRITVVENAVPTEIYVPTRRLSSDIISFGQQKTWVVIDNSTVNWDKIFYLNIHVGASTSNIGFYGFTPQMPLSIGDSRTVTMVMPATSDTTPHLITFNFTNSRIITNLFLGWNVDKSVWENNTTLALYIEIYQ